MSRGAPPAIEIRASRPLSTNGFVRRGSRMIAISPAFDIERTAAVGRPNGRDSGLSGRLMKTSNGAPSQEAE